MRIVPAIDIIEGKCVRLEKGDYNTKKIYNEDPLEVALEFEAHGIQYLHLVDLDGAKSAHIVNWKIIEKIANKTGIIIDFGGGIKTDRDIEIAFNSGASKITGGSIAVKDKNIFSAWIEKYGSEKVILGADVKGESIATNGWLETSNENIYDFILDYYKKGIREVICTDISKDGMLEGTNKELYKNIISQFDEIKLVASGGVNSMKEIEMLTELGNEAAIIGKAIYENKISLKELSSYIHG